MGGFLDGIDGDRLYRRDRLYRQDRLLLTGGRKYAPKGNGKDEKEKKQSALPYLIIDGEGAYYQKLIKATLLVAWGLQNQ